MRTYLTAFVALGFSCGAASASSADDHHRTPLHAIGRYCGVGYSAGYHARYPNRPGFVHRAHVSHTDGSASHGLAYQPGMCSQCSSSPPAIVIYDAPHHQSVGQAVSPSSHQSLPAAPAALTPSPQTPAPETNVPPSSLQSPSDDVSPSDRAGFFKRLPNLRGASRVSDLPPPPPSPKKASVARSSMLEVDAR